jgi:hypothetical protein
MAQIVLGGPQDHDLIAGIGDVLAKILGHGQSCGQKGGDSLG